jgi:sRNA-binding regulator protein Hfq
MKKAFIILAVLVTAGCKSPVQKQYTSDFDAAIENLSVTTEQLEAVRREKDFFVKVLEDFEQQKAEYPNLVNTQQIPGQIQIFDDWHRDIAQRERYLAMQHAINVFAAQNQVSKRRLADPNKIILASPLPIEP